MGGTMRLGGRVISSDSVCICRCNASIGRVYRSATGAACKAKASSLLRESSRGTVDVVVEHWGMVRIGRRSNGAVTG